MTTLPCRFCGSVGLKRIIDLGFHPLADTFLTASQLDEPEATYPLRVLLCETCGYAMSEYVVPPEERYQKADYSYTASNSPVAVSHFTEMAAAITEDTGLGAEDLVVDIGGNDGTLLAAFSETVRCRVLNIEPSKNIAELSRKRGVTTIEDFFNEKAAKRISEEGGAAVITATNVFNHVEDLNGFAGLLLQSLRKEGAFVFEVPWLLDLVAKTAFDTIYLEHVSYFGVKFLKTLFAKYGLYIHRIVPSDYMGGSIRVFIKRSMPAAGNVDEYVRQEQKTGIYDADSYGRFMERVKKFRFNLCEQLYGAKRAGGVIIGIGAATKGNTLLNYCKIDRAFLDCVTDASPLKIGKYTPGSHLPIVADTDIPRNATHALILPWNIGDFLKKKLAHLNLEFIVPHAGGN